MSTAVAAAPAAGASVTAGEYGKPVEIDGLPTRLVVGLEIHCQLATRTKLFCSCAVESGAAPNTRTCPVCLGMPGVLPVMNRKAFEYAVRVGLALGCRIASFSKWDRKNYYYPDLPKNYQISQYDLPLCGEGVLEFPFAAAPGGTKRVRIRRAHLEEDAGKLLHEGRSESSQVDLNRTGTPLLEIVTEPDLHSPEEVREFAERLRALLVWLGVTEGNMQKGHMRFEPNINVHIQTPAGTVKTPIVEIKNLNSFMAVERAVAYEHRAQVARWRETGKVMLPGTKVTRGWDADLEETFPQREKEEAGDYRYFPDPDLVPVTPTEAFLAETRAALPELPLARFARFTKDYGLSAQDAEVLTADRFRSDYYETVVRLSGHPKPAANWVTQQVLSQCNERKIGLEEFPVSAERLAGLVKLSGDKRVNSTQARDLFALMLEKEGTAEALGKAAGILADGAGLTDEEVLKIVDQAIAENPKPVEDYRKGKKGAANSLMGPVSRAVKGRRPAEDVRRLLLERLDGK
jgi:aspartyl-tRNA(Asn)/glutamyl-tRNA(Gln) amidotransferase subunit B